MEFSNPDLQNPQISCPSFSLSIPSEPPDLGNWFPSYEYESPVLDSHDNVGNFIFEDRQIRKENFFLDDSEKGGRGESLRGFDGKRKKDEVLVGDDKGETPSLSDENILSCCSPSLPSEPIDVRNWFSSYVYESPALDTSYGFEDSLYKENECEEDGLVVEESNREKAEDYGEFERTRTRDVIVNCGNYCGDNQLEKQLLNEDDPRSGKGKQNLPDKSNMCSGSTLKRFSNDERLRNHGQVESSSLDQDLPCTLNSSRGVGILPLIVQGTCSSGRKLSPEFLYRMENVKDSEAKVLEEAASHLAPTSNQKSLLVNEESTRKSTCGHEDKEKGVKDMSKDGFVTTRKGRCSKANAENLQEIPKGPSKVTISKAGAEDHVIQRRALSERTNFHPSGAMETTGKWQCPQKRKPNLGPPLKQLRLERWVQRL